MSDDIQTETVVIPVGNARLSGVLFLPPRPLGIVVLIDVSGSTLPNPSHVFVARALARFGLTALVINLLTASEATIDAHTAWLRGDTRLLAERIAAARRWLATRPDTEDLPLGLFAADAGAAAALSAIQDEPGFAAIVCWTDEKHADGGRVPTLFVTASEPLDAVTDLAVRWFEQQLGSAWRSPPSRPSP